MSQNMLINFQDTGQDFLEWIVSENGEVLACAPFQAFHWVGRKVLAAHMVDGNLCLILNAGDGVGEYNLKHAVASIVETDRVDFSEQAVAS